MDFCVGEFFPHPGKSREEAVGARFVLRGSDEDEVGKILLSLEGFALRRRFHDGTPLSAHDVAATYRSVLDPEVGSPHRGSLHMLQRVQVLDADTVDFHLATPDPLFPGRLVVGILPAPLMSAGHGFNANAVGSGPFRFVSWPEAERLRIERLLPDGRLPKSR